MLGYMLAPMLGSLVTLLVATFVFVCVGRNSRLSGGRKVVLYFVLIGLLFVVLGDDCPTSCDELEAGSAEHNACITAEDAGNEFADNVEAATTAVPNNVFTPVYDWALDSK